MRHRAQCAKFLKGRNEEPGGRGGCFGTALCDLHDQRSVNKTRITVSCCKASSSGSRKRLLRFEEESRQRRKSERQRKWPAVNGTRLGHTSAAIAEIAAAVVAAVAVQQFAPVSARRNSDAIVLPGHGSEAADDQHDIPGILSPAQKGNHAGVGIVAVHPLEAGGVVVEFMEGGLLAVEAVQLLHPGLHAAVHSVLQ